MGAHRDPPQRVARRCAPSLCPVTPADTLANQKPSGGGQAGLAVAGRAPAHHVVTFVKGQELELESTEGVFWA